MITFDMMCHQVIQLGGWNWHKRLCVPIDRGNNMSVYQMTEFSIHKLYLLLNRIEFIWSIHMISNDKTVSIFKICPQYECSQSKHIQYFNIRTNITSTY